MLYFVIQKTIYGITDLNQSMKPVKQYICIIFKTI